ncbi:MAG: fibrobacter succinogenes major paralogous domain-containing protein [Fibromonadaceae bacterium]|jgi:uncharacterized protein (TIGR02145 family)|nr:fibrobacter succinogenes major paralogous domain-containing protein [Fibromonadaceae bacterium]
MKKAITLLVLFCIAACDQQKDTLTDKRDGKAYKTVKIGKQVWMAENLNYEVDGNKCYNDSISYCNKYGRLYNWATAMKACPKGWHLPSNAEWDALYRFADGTSGTDSPYESETAVRHLKAASGWYGDGNGEDTFGFSALPGGGGYSSGNFYDVGYYGNWWSASEIGSGYAYDRHIVYSNDNKDYYGYESRDYHSDGIIHYYCYGKGCLFSVRCVRD